MVSKRTTRGARHNARQKAAAEIAAPSLPSSVDNAPSITAGVVVSHEVRLIHADAVAPVVDTCSPVVVVANSSVANGSVGVLESDVIVDGNKKGRTLLILDLNGLLLHRERVKNENPKRNRPKARQGNSSGQGDINNKKAKNNHDISNDDKTGDSSSHNIKKVDSNNNPINDGTNNNDSNNDDNNNNINNKKNLGESVHTQPQQSPVKNNNNKNSGNSSNKSNDDNTSCGNISDVDDVIKGADIRIEKKKNNSNNNTKDNRRNKTAKTENKFSLKTKMVGNFRVSVRPHLSEFLDFVFTHFDVALWSSAQKHNVVGLMDSILKKDQKAALVFCWHNATCTDAGVHPIYPRKNLLLKELSKVWETFPQYTSENTLLLDDSVLKTQRNPIHTAVHPPEWFPTQTDDNELLVSSGDGLAGFLVRIAERAPGQSVPMVVEQDPYAIVVNKLAKETEGGKQQEEERQQLLQQRNRKEYEERRDAQREHQKQTQQQQQQQQQQQHPRMHGQEYQQQDPRMHQRQHLDYQQQEQRYRQQERPMNPQQQRDCDMYHRNQQDQFQHGQYYPDQCGQRYVGEQQRNHNNNWHGQQAQQQQYGYNHHHHHHHHHNFQHGRHQPQQQHHSHQHRQYHPHHPHHEGQPHHGQRHHDERGHQRHRHEAQEPRSHRS